MNMGEKYFQDFDQRTKYWQGGPLNRTGCRGSEVQFEPADPGGRFDFIHGCVGRGLNLDLRIRPRAPAASGNLGFWKSWNVASLGSGSKN